MNVSDRRDNPYDPDPSADYPSSFPPASGTGPLECSGPCSVEEQRHVATLGVGGRELTPRLIAKQWILLGAMFCAVAFVAWSLAGVWGLYALAPVVVMGAVRLGRLYRSASKAATQPLEDVRIDVRIDDQGFTMNAIPPLYIAWSEVDRYFRSDIAALVLCRRRPGIIVFRSGFRGDDWRRFVKMMEQRGIPRVIPYPQCPACDAVDALRPTVRIAGPSQCRYCGHLAERQGAR